MEPDDVTRRTLLAAERTWLAWWRAAIAAAGVAIGVGGVVPQLIGGERVPYIVLGAGYALLSVGIFIYGGRRQTAVDRALAEGSYAPVDRAWVLGLTFSGATLALATLAVILVQP